VTATEPGWAVLSLHYPEPSPTETWTSDDTNQWIHDTSSVRVWTTSDGVRWAEVDTETGPPGVSLLTHMGTAPFTASGDTWAVALAGAADDSPGPREPTVWVTTDAGVTWTEHAVWSDPDDAGFQAFDLAATGDGFTLAGYQDRPADRGVHFVHHSEDGTTWQHCWTDPHELSSIEMMGDSTVAYDSGNGLVYVRNEH
jgi:hypothetical protein